MANRIDYSLILPCYNEATHFRESVPQIVSVLALSRYQPEIIFVDDGSSDETRKLISAFCKTHPQCRYIFHETNQGRGGAVMTGIRAAKADVVGYMDIDCEVSPLYIPVCIQAIKENKADIVVGKRIYRTSTSSLVREILSNGYRFLADSLLSTGGIDTESGYKFFNRRALLPVLETITNSGWFWDTQSIVQSRRFGLRIMEIPVLFLRKQEKPSSVHIFRDTIDYVVELAKYRSQLHSQPSVPVRYGKRVRLAKSI